jgi:beta-glucosidase
MTAMSDMSMQAGPGRSYRWLNATKSAPLFEFGAGLSYSTFGLKLATSAAAAGAGAHDVVVTNTGTVPAANVVLLFARARCEHGDAASPPPGLVPIKSLIDFNRTETLAPGASETLSFTLVDEQLALVNATGARVLCKGEFDLSFFDGSSTLRLTHTVAASAVVSTIPLPPQDE